MYETQFYKVAHYSNAEQIAGNIFRECLEKLQRAYQAIEIPRMHGEL